MYTGPASGAIRISLASPAQIRSWSHGEVSNPATLNYLTGKPEMGGLSCERIFGPTNDWTCFCGKYRRERTPGFVCECCGVLIGPRLLRRLRMGHIELACPVAHPWFARGMPSILARLLGLSRRQLLSVLSYTTWLVTSIDPVARAQALAHLDEEDEAAADLYALLTELAVGDVLEDAQYRALSLLASPVCCVGTGAAAIGERLRALDLDAEALALRAQLQQTGQRALSKRLEVVEAFRTSGVDPAWMILDVIPVLPPALRPLVPLANGRLATADLNALYERVLVRNERVKRFMALDAPAIIRHHEQRLLQEACDALFDNAHRRRPVLGSHGQPLACLTRVLSGKRGRFRRNLLGKRVDYSGRSVIVVGPHLQLQQCGLPTAMCLELFKPFLIRRLLERQLAASAKAAKRMIERARRDDFLLWELLEEVMRDKVVLLNRAPTLHRLSIQAFEPVRVEGLAIQVHPLVCSAFNADFDGDQMAVHLPLSEEAQAEARALLLSTRNLRSPATGEPSITLSQEIALGLFYLTQDRPSDIRAGRIMADAAEARLALEHGVIELHTPIVVRVEDALLYDAPDHSIARPARGRIETTVGRLIFNEALPHGLRFRNYEMTKERLKHLVATCLCTCGEETTVRLADRLKTLGFHYATRSGTSFALSDIAVPPEKSVILAQADAEAEALEDLHCSGMITAEERDRQRIELWTKTTEDISARLEAALDPWGSLATIIQSGATKAKFQQIRQLSGIRGLMASPSGKIIPIPVRGNYLEGLRVWEIFVAASGARKGFMDRSLNTARSGYLTRKLVEAAGEVWITMFDCQTTASLLITEEESQAMGLPGVRSRLLSRVLAEPLPEVGYACGTRLSEEVVDRLKASGITAVRVLSPLTCTAPVGLCQRCYGADLATGELVRPGTAVGIIAAQSVGEPGTQLTMRTFHSGGIAGAQGDITQGLPRVEELFGARPPKNRATLSEIEGSVHLETTEQGDHLLRVVSPDGQTAWSAVIEQRRAVLVTPGEHVTVGMPLSAGAKSPQDLLRLQGREAVARYLVSEVQQVYRGTGVYLHDKHLECIVRQMLRYVLVEEPGDTELLPWEIVDRFACEQCNAQVLAQGGSPALARPMVLGLSQVASHSSSWIAAASFQETSRVLAKAAIGGSHDDLVSFKARIAVGRRIPTDAAEESTEQAAARLRPLVGRVGGSTSGRERS